MNLQKLLYYFEMHRYWNDATINKITLYFNNKIEFEEINFPHHSNKDFAFTYKYLENFKKNFKEFSKDKEIFKKIIKILFKTLDFNNLNILTKYINMNKIIKVYPEFYSEIIEKDKFISAIFIQKEKQYSSLGIHTLYNIFGREETFNFIKNSSNLKKDGHYKFKNNLECLFLLEDMSIISKEKKYENLKPLTLKFLSILSDDYNGKKNRNSLEPEVKESILQLVDKEENWNENLKLFKKNLFEKFNEEVLDFIKIDKDFNVLFNILTHIEVEKKIPNFIKRFKKMILNIAPNYYIEKVFFQDRKLFSSSTNGKKEILELENLIEDSFEVKNELLESFILHTINHYSREQKVTTKVFKLLIKTFGVESVLEHFKPRTLDKKVNGIYLIGKYGDKNLVKEIKEELENLILNNFFNDIAIDSKSSLLLKSYINGNIDSVDLDNLLEKKIDIKYKRNKWHLFDGDKLKRLVKMFIESNRKELIDLLPSSFYREDDPIPHEYMLKKVIELNIDLKNFLNIFTEYTGASYSKAIEYLENNGVNCLELGIKFNATKKKLILDSIYGDNKAKREAILLPDFLKENSKGTVQSALNNLKNLDSSVLAKVEEKIYNEIKTYTKDKEILAVDILCHYATDKNKLKSLYNEVKEPKSRDIIAKLIGLNLKDLFEDRKGNFDLDSYLDSVYKKNTKLPMNIENLNKVIRKDGKDSTRALEQLIILYKNSDELSINVEALLIVNGFTPESIIDFSKSVFLYWKSGKMDMKSKWQLLIPIIHGDYNLIKELGKLIEELASNSRHKLAIYLLKALSLNGSKEAFITIDKIGRRTKFKSLRFASEEAFEIAAKELGISKGELGDQLVGNLGLIQGHIPLDYGNQVVKLFIGNNLKFEIEKENGKRVKSLPKGTKDDDELLVKEANEKFKLLKKQLKDIVALQTSRMEDALVEYRLWPAKKWKDLFLENPIMNTIGKGLLWGIYENDQLIKTFAFDTDIFDVDYENVELMDDNKIGIVHPLELEKDEVEAWKEVFNDNEIDILFSQLDRKILEVEDDESLEFKPVNYLRKSPNTLINRLRKKGWNIGSVKDAGGFEELYKELKEVNIGIEVTLDGFPGVGGYGYEAFDSIDGLVGVEKIEFYRIDIIKRGSYLYDELEDHEGLRYMPKELPKRIISELLLELEKGLS